MMDRRSFLSYASAAVGSLFVLPKIFAKENKVNVGYGQYQEHGKTNYIIQVNADGTYTPERMICYKCGRIEKTENIRNWILIPKGSLCPNCTKYLYSDNQILELIDKSTYRRLLTEYYDLTGCKSIAKKIIQDKRGTRSICLGFDQNYDYDKYMRFYRHDTMWLLN